MKFCGANLTPPDNVRFLQRFNQLLQHAMQRNLTSHAWVYKKILSSLKRYPLPIKSSVQACRLEGVGKGSAFTFSGLGDDLQEPVSDEDRRLHRQKVLNAMRSFAETLETDSTIVFEPPLKRQPRHTLRLNPGTSSWTILICLYVFSKQFPKGQLSEVDIRRGSELLQKFDPRIRISNFKSVNKLRSHDYVTATPSDVKKNASQDTLKLRRKKGIPLVYQLTQKGQAATESLLCAMDLPSSATLLHNTPSKSTAETPTHADLVPPKSTGCTVKHVKHLGSPEDPTTSGKVSKKMAEELKRKQQAENFRTFFASSSQKTSQDQTTIQRCADHISYYASHNTSFLMSSCPCPPVQDNPLTQALVTAEQGQPEKELSSSEKERHTPVCYAHTVDPHESSRAPGDQLLSGLLDYIQDNSVEEKAFKIFCLIDYRELNNRSREASTTPSLNPNPYCENTSRDSSSESLLLQIFRQKKLNIESTRLPLGDFAFVCRFKKPKHLILSHRLRSILDSKVSGSESYPTPFETGYDQDIDFILPYLIERKTCQDLVSSIMDGRYEDQKHRLLHSPGIECIVYLVEGTLQDSTAPYQQINSVHNSSLAFPNQLVQSAIASIQIRGGIHVVFSSDLLHTAGMIISIYEILQGKLTQFFHESAQHPQEMSPGNAFLLNLIAHCPLRSVWNYRCQHLMTVHDVFGRQLRSIESLGEKTVLFILKHFSNPSHLKEALEKFPQNAAFQLAFRDPPDVNETMSGAVKRQRRNVLTTKVLMSLRELYAPSTLSFCATPTSYKQKKKKRTMNREGVQHSPPHKP